MATHGYYSTPHWRQLRKEALRRDGYRCTVAGCGRRATHVDHIETRPRQTEPSPADRLNNLRSYVRPTMRKSKNIVAGEVAEAGQSSRAATSMGGRSANEPAVLGLEPNPVESCPIGADPRSGCPSGII
jgi:hypothetical protein